MNNKIFIVDGYKYLIWWRLLGSKTLGLNVLEFHFVMLANHD